MTAPMDCAEVLTARQAAARRLGPAPEGASHATIWTQGRASVVVWERKARNGTGIWDDGAWNWRTEGHYVARRLFLTAQAPA